jgi:alkanesulfonate monooxygenase SsuD/methylene tetrahydromethanopterin reductase-like flavin-dependent oxidoreductase (luciferase family)
VKFGTTITGVSFRSIPTVQAYKENGFESLWVPEHLVIPADLPAVYPYTESGIPSITSDTASYDPWVEFGYIASCTSKSSKPRAFRSSARQ